MIKKCKGQGKTKGFGCGVELEYSERNGIKTYKQKYGLCLDCYSEWLFNSDQGKEQLDKAIIKAKQPRLELEKAKSEYKSEKSLSYLLQNTVNICHEYIRLRDKGKPCISSGVPWRNDFQAGHLYPAGKYPSLRFDEMNIHGQSVGDNIFQEGNESGYRVGLIKRYSKGFLDLLDSKALLDKKTSFKWDRNKLKEIQKYYKQKIAELE